VHRFVAHKPELKSVKRAGRQRTQVVAAFPRSPGATRLLVADEEVRLAGGLLEMRENLVAAVDGKHRDRLGLVDGAPYLPLPTSTPPHGSRFDSSGTFEYSGELACRELA
jgi:hypothetical protein